MFDELEHIDDELRQQVYDAPIPFKEEYWNRMEKTLDAQHPSDEVDQWLQHQVEESTFIMEEKDWSRMEAMLDEGSEPKRKAFPWWRGLSVLLLLITTGIAAYLIPKLHSKKKAIAQAEQEQVNTPSDTIKQPHAVTTYTDSAVATEPRENFTSQASTSSPNAQNTPIPSTARNSDGGNPSVPTDGNVDSTLSTSHTDAPISNPTQNPALSAKPDSSRIASADPNKVRTKTGPAGKSGKIARQRTKQKPTGSDTKSSSPPLPTNITPPATVAGTATKPNEYKNDKGTYRETARTTTPDYTPVDYTISNPRYRADLKNYVPEYRQTPDSVTVITYSKVKGEEGQTAAKDSMKNSSMSDTASSSKQQFYRSLIAFAQAGIHLNNGLKGNLEANRKMAVSPYIGIGFEKYFQTKLSVSAAIGFTYHNALNQQKDDYYLTYSFGVDSTQIRLTAKRLYQLQAPILLRYNLGKKHQLMGGITAIYSYQTYGTMEEILYPSKVANFNANPSPTLSTVTPITDINRGYREFDFVLNAGYAYRIHPTLWLELAYQQGFMDLTRNSYFTSSTRNVLTRFSVGLKFNFYEKSQPKK